MAFCSNCGKEIVNGENFCTNCGANTWKIAQDSDYEAQASSFVDSGVEYYIPKFREMRAKNSSISWNWCAFFFNIYWLIYRKMYLYAAIAFLISFILLDVIWFGPIVFDILMGMFGNYIYMKYIDSNISKIHNMSFEEKNIYIYRKKGVSVWAVVICFGISLLLSVISYILFAILMFSIF